MGRRAVVIVGLVLVLVVAVVIPAAMTEGPLPVGTVVAVTGTVQVGRDGVWQEAAPRLHLFEGQTIRTAASSGAEIMFDGELPARLGEKAEIPVADLLLKARLEKLRAKIAVPGDTIKADIQVTPLTGVRGTEKTEEKAEDLKREHYWSESAPEAK
jgi:hypothetical protein